MRKAKENLWKTIMLACTLITCAILIFLIGYVLVQGIKGLSVNFLTTSPSYTTGNIGILPDIMNTVYLLIVSLLVLVPLGLAQLFTLVNTLETIEL